MADGARGAHDVMDAVAALLLTRAAKSSSIALGACLPRANLHALSPSQTPCPSSADLTQSAPSPESSCVCGVKERIGPLWSCEFSRSLALPEVAHKMGVAGPSARLLQRCARAIGRLQLSRACVALPITPGTRLQQWCNILGAPPWHHHMRSKTFR